MDRKVTAYARPQGQRASYQQLHIALVGNFPPRRCGISTYTSDLRDALIESPARPRCDVYAMADSSARHAYPPAVKFEIRENALADYTDAAGMINRSGADIVCVQHEFGIFGGAAGSHLLSLLAGLNRPIVTTLHTVLANPSDDQRRVMTRIAQRSVKLVVMAEKGREILQQVYGIPVAKISVIPHGAPDHAFVDSSIYKQRLGLDGRDVLLTFGLLSPNKGIDTMIRALPAIRAARPGVLYIVLGATHPHLLAREGEAYRERLAGLASELGVTDCLQFVNEYVDRKRLVAYLGAADVYVTPYRAESQITSGTLSYAVGMGKAIVSTPYLHARELLGADCGLMAPFGDSAALAAATLSLIEDEALRDRVRKAAYEKGRDMIWARSAERHIALFSGMRIESHQYARPTARMDLPRPSLKGVELLTDNCGILQHSFFGAPDRTHGYCLDDNARALILVDRLKSMAFPAAQLDSLATIYAAFINHAWNSTNGKFRNFMSYARVWLDEEGSQDSFGRAFWALGETSAAATREDLRLWANALAERAMNSASQLTATRARAFAILGLARLAASRFSSGGLARSALREHASHLSAMLRNGADWFEPWLSYDNARLPEALLRAGIALNDAAMIKAGLRTLSWLSEVHTAPSGVFRPVGSQSLGKAPDDILPFDQQPLEAAAVVDACAAALEASGDRAWIGEARRAFAWYTGDNDLGTPLVSWEDGLCYDGLQPHGLNRNHGAESVLSFQLALAAMDSLAQKAPVATELRRTDGEDRRRVESTL